MRLHKTTRLGTFYVFLTSDVINDVTYCQIRNWSALSVSNPKLDVKERTLKKNKKNDILNNKRCALPQI